MSTFEPRLRQGMGSGFDPHFDARAGRRAATPEGWPDNRALVAGYIELSGDRPLDDLESLLERMFLSVPGPHARASERRQDERRKDERPSRPAPPAAGLLAEIHYLLTDPRCGLTLPMRDFMPSAHQDPDRAEAFRAVIAQLHARTKGRLKLAARIDLVVDFNFNAIGASLNSARTHALEAARHGREPDSALRFDQVVRGSLSMKPLGTFRIGLSARCRPQLANAMNQLGSPALGGPLDYGIAQTGENTVVGIVDFGCDFAHPSFRTAAPGNPSRIAALWDQNDGPTVLRPMVTVEGETFHFGHGRLFTTKEINTALASPDPYKALTYDPHANHCSAFEPGTDNGPKGAHGTFVMEVAAGGERTVGGEVLRPCGVASKADIVFVQVRPAWYGDRRSLDLNDVVKAIAFVFHVADSRNAPCVVNVSLNTMSGPHDGDSEFDHRISMLLRSGKAGVEARGRSVVVAAGNLPDSASQSLQWQHMAGVATEGVGVEFSWLIGRQDTTLNSIEIWYDAPQAWLQLTLVSPDGQRLGPIQPGSAEDIFCDGQWCGCIIGSCAAPEVPTPGVPPPATSGVDRQCIYLELEIEVEVMQMWRVIVEVAPGSPQASPARIAFDAWLERDDDGPSGLCRYDPPQAVDSHDLARSIGTMSCGADAVVVGAYSAAFTPAGRWGLSGNGPDRRLVCKPDVSAPGHFMTLVRSRRGQGEAEPLALGECGTSFAAPFVSGTIACVYQIAPNATLAQVQAAVTETAIRMGNDPTWTPDLGRGMLDPKGVLRYFLS